MNGQATNGNGQDVRKVAVITGGASGLGAVMAQHFADEGYNVAIFDLNDEWGESMAASITPHDGGPLKNRAIFRKCDVSAWQDQANNFKDVYREFGRIDVVCANAGISESGASALAKIEEDEPTEPNLKVLGVNLSGVIFCKSSTQLKRARIDGKLTQDRVAVKLALHYMNKNEPSDSSRGNIICTASNAGLYAFPVSPIYAASKSGVIGLVRSTAPILQRYKIRINALAPAVLGMRLFRNACDSCYTKLTIANFQ